MTVTEKVKLTKKALNDFIGWTTTRYNDYMGYGTKREAVETAFSSITNGFYTQVSFDRKKNRNDRKDESKIVFELKCASPVGENITKNKNSYWKTKQGGDTYTVDCKSKTITALYSQTVIEFI